MALEVARSRAREQRASQALLGAKSDALAALGCCLTRAQFVEIAPMVESAPSIASVDALVSEQRQLLAAELSIGARPMVDSPPAPVAMGVSWTICCMDGTTFSVVMPEGAPVAALKRAISVLREVQCFTIAIFVRDVEDALEDATPLCLVDLAPLFLLLRVASDRLALEVLFQSTGGAGWARRGGWMTDADLGEWEGVTVDGEGRVIKLDLHTNGLAGPLPSEITQLSALQELWLNSNALTGPIIPELGQLRALTGLDLDNNQLVGPIPAALGQLGATLTSLCMSGNRLSGRVPSGLRQAMLGSGQRRHTRRLR
jgi:hypothetical protein